MLMKNNFGILISNCPQSWWGLNADVENDAKGREESKTKAECKGQMSIISLFNKYSLRVYRVQILGFPSYLDIHLIWMHSCLDTESRLSPEF